MLFAMHPEWSVGMDCLLEYIVCFWAGAITGAVAMGIIAGGDRD